MGGNNALNMNKNIKDVMRLIYLADINFLICKKIYDYLDPQNRKENYDFLLLSANNAFMESIGIIHTLIASTKKKKFA